MFGYATAQKILRVGYFWFSMFKDCITTAHVGATFQQELSYTFHDIKHIVHPYLDDLPDSFHETIGSPIALKSDFH